MAILKGKTYLIQQNNKKRKLDQTTKCLNLFGKILKTQKSSITGVNYNLIFLTNSNFRFHVRSELLEYINILKIQ